MSGYVPRVAGMANLSGKLIIFFFFLAANVNGSLFKSLTAYRNACKSQPCKNQSKCLSIFGSTMGFRCLCRPGFYGLSCDKVLSDPCASNPCSHRGKCVAILGYHKCFCKPYFTGKNCERLVRFHDIVNPCYANPCKNGGSCQQMEFPRLGFQCKCSENFIGANCETAKQVDYCQFVTCNNNGKCVNADDRHRCECPTGFGGDLCENESEHLKEEYKVLDYATSPEAVRQTKAVISSSSEASTSRPTTESDPGHLNQKYEGVNSTTPGDLLQTNLISTSSSSEASTSMTTTESANEPVILPPQSRIHHGAGTENELSASKSSAFPKGLIKTCKCLTSPPVISPQIQIAASRLSHRADPNIDTSTSSSLTFSKVIIKEEVMTKVLCEDTKKHVGYTRSRNT